MPNDSLTRKTKLPWGKRGPLIREGMDYIQSSLGLRWNHEPLASANRAAWYMSSPGSETCADPGMARFGPWEWAWRGSGRMWKGQVAEMRSGQLTVADVHAGAPPV